VIVVGAGPAGLAVSSCLARAGVSYVLLERENSVAPAWRRHYDRLHLHTSRAFSSLPHRPMPHTYPRYPSRDDVVDYLASYAGAEGIEPRLGVEVVELRPGSALWEVETRQGVLRAHAVVVASGTNGEPNRPRWPGLETFPGRVLHSAEYRNGDAFSDLDVLVVGLGNSGGEIALDLVERGARPAVSVRSPVNVIPRDVLGIPVLAIAIPLARLPPRLADTLVWPILKIYYPSYRALGLRKAELGPFRQIRERNRIPLLDIGTVREIRRGRIQVRSDISSIAGSTVRFTEGDPRTFDAIVMATGYEPRVPSGAGEIPAGDHVGGASGLYFCGFYVSPTGMLREIGIEAEEIAERIVEQLARPGSA
jgi:indole-3-pyruvate monooxygenase